MIYISNISIIYTFSTITFIFIFPFFSVVIFYLHNFIANSKNSLLKAFFYFIFFRLDLNIFEIHIFKICYS